MFDPTVFDNLKVALENHIYDLDNLEEIITVTSRVDRIEMASMSRAFAIGFVLRGREAVTAHLRLEASLKNLAAEILEMPGENPSCTLALRFDMDITDINKQCAKIDDALRQIWQPEVAPRQTLQFLYGQDSERPYRNRVELFFARTINEDQMEDLTDLLSHVNRTLEALEGIALETH